MTPIQISKEIRDCPEKFKDILSNEDIEKLYDAEQVLLKIHVEQLKAQGLFGIYQNKNIISLF